MIGLIVLVRVAEDLDVLRVSNEDTSLVKLKGLAEALDPSLTEANMLMSDLCFSLEQRCHWPSHFDLNWDRFSINLLADSSS